MHRATSAWGGLSPSMTYGGRAGPTLPFAQGDPLTGLDSRAAAAWARSAVAERLRSPGVARAAQPRVELSLRCAR